MVTTRKPEESAPRGLPTGPVVTIPDREFGQMHYGDSGRQKYTECHSFGQFLKWLAVAVVILEYLSVLTFFLMNYGE